MTIQRKFERCPGCYQSGPDLVVIRDPLEGCEEPRSASRFGRTGANLWKRKCFRCRADQPELALD